VEAVTSERPILFSGAMVRAILAGQKTQTRRVVKLRELGPSPTRGYDWCFRDRRGMWNDVNDKLLVDKFCPYGKPGDSLWVRETWGAAREFDDVKPTHLDPDRDIFYQATDEVPGGIRWRPSIHMPRWASRLALDVASVHVERLQEITTEAIIAEGVDVPDVDYSVAGSPPELDSEREAYALRRWIDLWDGINGAKHPWPSNPFVWVVEFKRTEGNK
jgi:hypothetical protein